MKKKTSKKKVSKKKIEVAPEVAPVIEEQSAPVENNEAPAQVAMVEIKKPVSIRSNMPRQEQLNNQIGLVMAFNPQIVIDVNGITHVTIGFEHENSLHTEGETVLEAMLKMFKKLS